MIDLQSERQQNPVAEETAAITAVVRPILTGLLSSLKRDVLDEAGGYDAVKFKMLGRLYRQGDGDAGICFEYAVHDAVRRGDPDVVERVEDALRRHCGIPGDTIHSILFGAEKTGAVRLLETARDLLTDHSRLLPGSRGRPVLLKRHIDAVARAFRRRDDRARIPQSIAGLWKADLFLGTDDDAWVGTTVKINSSHLEPARGLRIGLVPARQGRDDRVYRDEGRNLVVCPLPYDHAFMETFYRGWETIQQVIAADCNLPTEVNLPAVAQREVARRLTERREFAVVDVIEALRPLAQPGLLQTVSKPIDVFDRREGPTTAGAIIAPIATLSDRS